MPDKTVNDKKYLFGHICQEKKRYINLLALNTALALCLFLFVVAFYMCMIKTEKTFMGSFECFNNTQCGFYSECIRCLKGVYKMPLLTGLWFYVCLIPNFNKSSDLKVFKWVFSILIIPVVYKFLIESFVGIVVLVYTMFNLL